MSRTAELGLSEAVRALDEQRAAVDTIQQRAGVLLAFAAVANVGLGQVAFGGQRGMPLPPLTIGGIAAAAVAGMLLLSLCWPRAYRFTLPAPSIVGSTPPFDIDDDVLVATVATAMEVTRSRQEEQIARLSVTLKVSLVALAANAFAWCAIAIWVRR